jgi:hypothetical protein
MITEMLFISKTGKMYSIMEYTFSKGVNRASPLHCIFQLGESNHNLVLNNANCKEF